VTAALRDAGAPDGTFALVAGHEAGIALVQHPAIAAAAFTGSLRGGRALFDLAVRRPDPIPFFGELGSTNPVVVTRGADDERGDELAAGLAASFQLGSGQFCTKPGVVFVPRGARIESAIGEHIGTDAVELLTDSISTEFARGIDRLLAVTGPQLVAGSAPSNPEEIRPAIVAVDIADLAADRDILLAEVFGPVTVLVRYDDLDEVTRELELTEGSLTATIHAAEGDDVGALVEVMRDRSGRVLFDGWPTGVAVSWSQHHGGPWPATTSQFTSVGATALRRFQRPLVYQDADARYLPDELLEHNPLRIPRRVDGVMVVAG
jgi:NADP-dependent aldehyde dehydrogenase